MKKPLNRSPKLGGRQGELRVFRPDKPECIDLRRTYGDRYYIVVEEPAKDYCDPWLQIIPCRYGHIYVHGDDELGFASRGRGLVKSLLELPFVRVEQDGADGVNVVFEAKYLPAVARVVKPKQRRKVSEATKQRLRDMGRAFRFSTGQGASELSPDAT